LVTQVATVSASLRQGITTVSSTWTPFTVYLLHRGGYGFEGSTSGHPALFGRQ
jgi:hypothetical protein